MRRELLVKFCFERLVDIINGFLTLTETEDYHYHLEPTKSIREDIQITDKIDNVQIEAVLISIECVNTETEESIIIKAGQYVDHHCSTYFKIETIYDNEIFYVRNLESHKPQKTEIKSSIEEEANCALLVSILNNEIELIAPIEIENIFDEIDNVFDN